VTDRSQGSGTGPTQPPTTNGGSTPANLTPQSESRRAVQGLGVSRNRISPRLRRRVRQDFGLRAGRVLYTLGHVEFPMDHGEVTERLQAATVLLANGDLDRFDREIALGKTDWRDLLVAADLAHDDWPEKLDRFL